MTLVPTMHLRFVKRRVGANTVRILQQGWVEDAMGAPGLLYLPERVTAWQDVPLADEKATQRTFPPKGD